MTIIRKEYVGAAAATTLSGSINSSATAFTVADGATFPTGSYPFVLVIDRGTASEEKLLCSGRSGDTITLSSASNRGYDSTVAASHSIGAAVEHCLDATSISEANKAAVNTIGKVTTAGDTLYSTGTESLERLPLGQAGQRYAVNSSATAPEWVDPPTEDVFNVMDYGAVGNGVTNDVLAIQTAISTALTAGGGIVYFPPGIYIVGDVLVPAIGTTSPFTSGTGLTVELAGAGMYASILKGSQQFVANGIIGYGRSGNNPVLAQVVARDLTLDGNYSGSGGTVAQPASNAGALVSLSWPHTSETTPTHNGLYHRFERVRFYRPTGYAFQPTQGVALTNCLFDECGQPDLASGGLHYDNLGSGPGDAVVVECAWKDSSGNFADFVSATPGDFIRLVMTGCVSHNHQVGGVYACGQGSVISGNRLDNDGAYSAGIGYDSATDVANRSNNIVSNNTLDNIDVNSSGLSLNSYGDIVFGNIAADSAYGDFFQSILANNGIGFGSGGISSGIGANVHSDGMSVYAETNGVGNIYLRPAGQGSNVNMAVVQGTGGVSLYDDTATLRSTVLSGTGVPSAGIGANGDFYFRQNGSAGAHIYFKAAGAWGALV